MDAINELLSLVIQMILLISVPVLLVIAVPWFTQRVNEIKQRLSFEQLEILEKGVGIAVRAAEQAGLSGQIAATGTEKKAYAIQAAQAYIRRTGLKIDVSEIVGFLEAEVHRQFNDPASLENGCGTRSQLIDKAIETAVLASQNGSINELLSELNLGLPESKRLYAIEFTKKYLKQHGIDLDTSLIDGLLDAYMIRLRLQTLQAGKRG